MGAGLGAPGSNQSLPALGVGRGVMLWAALGLSQSCLWCCEEGLVPHGDTGEELTDVIIPPGKFMKSFLPVSGGS